MKAIAAAMLALLFAGCQGKRYAPTDVEDSDSCAFCRMAISQRQFAAEIVDEEETAHKFDDIGCMLQFLKEKKGSLKPAAQYVVDYDSRQWLAVEKAHFVRSAAIVTPMGGGIIAFSGAARAKAAAEEREGELISFGDLTAK